ncbi:MAG: helix-turn-helix domain-containing protein [Bradyrhizobium sp.]|uniref:helix-turn-helix domain-containing protein n=1 Tax=Bradyrhizobium sp. TaxID=376 RepID=UPI003D0B2F1F
MDLQRLLRPQEAADALGITLGSLYNLSYRREVPVVKIGRRLRFHPEALARFVAQRERKAIPR